LLLILTLLMGVVAIALPYLGFAEWFGFVPLPLPLIVGLLAIAALYLVACEVTKFLVFGKTGHMSKSRRGSC